MLAQVEVLTARAGLSMPKNWVCVYGRWSVVDDDECLRRGASGCWCVSGTSMAGFVDSQRPRDGWVCSQPRCRWLCAAKNFARVITGRGLQVKKMAQKRLLFEKPWNSVETIVRRGSTRKKFSLSSLGAVGVSESWPRLGRLRWLLLPGECCDGLCCLR